MNKKYLIIGGLAAVLVVGFLIYLFTGNKSENAAAKNSEKTPGEQAEAGQPDKSSPFDYNYEVVGEMQSATPAWRLMEDPSAPNEKTKVSRENFNNRVRLQIQDILRDHAWLIKIEKERQQAWNGNIGGMGPNEAIYKTARMHVASLFYY